MASFEPHKISAHPVSWDVARQVLDVSEAGTVARVRLALRIRDAITEKVFPDDRWPNPWHDWKSMKPEDRERELRNFEHPVDPLARVEIALTEDALALLKEKVEGMAGKMPIAHFRPLVPLLDEIDSALSRGK